MAEGPPPPQTPPQRPPGPHDEEIFGDLDQSVFSTPVARRESTTVLSPISPLAAAFVQTFDIAYLNHPPPPPGGAPSLAVWEPPVEVSGVRTPGQLSPPKPPPINPTGGGTTAPTQTGVRRVLFPSQPKQQQHPEQPPKRPPEGPAGPSRVYHDRFQLPEGQTEDPKFVSPDSTKRDLEYRWYLHVPLLRICDRRERPSTLYLEPLHVYLERCGDWIDKMYNDALRDQSLLRSQLMLLRMLSLNVVPWSTYTTGASIGKYIEAYNSQVNPAPLEPFTVTMNQYRQDVLRLEIRKQSLASENPPVGVTHQVRAFRLHNCIMNLLKRLYRANVAADFARGDSVASIVSVSVTLLLRAYHITRLFTQAHRDSVAKDPETRNSSVILHIRQDRNLLDTGLNHQILHQLFDVEEENRQNAIVANQQGQGGLDLIGDRGSHFWFDYLQPALDGYRRFLLRDVFEEARPKFWKDKCRPPENLETEDARVNWLVRDVVPAALHFYQKLFLAFRMLDLRMAHEGGQEALGFQTYHLALGYYDTALIDNDLTGYQIISPHFLQQAHDSLHKEDSRKRTRIADAIGNDDNEDEDEEQEDQQIASWVARCSLEDPPCSRCGYNKVIQYCLGKVSLCSDTCKQLYLAALL